MNIKYIDVHSHPHFSAFDKDREELFERMRAKSVATLAIGTDLKTSKEVAALAEREDLSDIILGATIGVHPTDKEDFKEEDCEPLLKSGKVVAVGECGLDYFRMDATDKSEKERQRELFVAQIEFAVKHKLPLMLHIRSSQGESDAHDDAFDILKTYKKEFPELHLHMHFFTASFEVAERFLELDATFGIPGVVTFAKDLQDTVKALPVEKILLETDAPYAAPVPYRGKRNEPTYVIEIAKFISELKGEVDSDIFAKNAMRTFNLK